MTHKDVARRMYDILLEEIQGTVGYDGNEKSIIFGQTFCTRCDAHADGKPVDVAGDLVHEPDCFVGLTEAVLRDFDLVGYSV